MTSLVSTYMRRDNSNFSGGPMDKNIAGHELAVVAHSEPVARRRVLTGAALLLTGVAVGSMRSDSAWAQAAAKPTAKSPAAVASKSPHQALIAAAKSCLQTGDTCQKHCVRLISAGDKSLADCLRTVRAMMPICLAMERLAGQDAKRLKELAKVCSDTCADCEAECRKHEFHHRECKACAESCAAMIKQCAAVMAA